MKDFERGYDAAIDDVQAAMKLAEVNTIGPAGLVSYNDTDRFIKELRKLRFARFSEQSTS